MIRSTAVPCPPAVGSQTHHVRPEELRGRAVGVFVCAGFGLVWAGPALSRLSAGLALVLLAVSIGLFAVLVSGGFRLRRAAVGLPPSTAESLDRDRRVAHRFGLVAGGEGVAIALAVAALNATGHPQLVPAAICAVVGLHFIPLAAMFAVRLYLGTAVALCLVAATTVILVSATAAPEWLWLAVPGFGAAVSLWVTGALLIRDSLARRIDAA